MTKKGKKRTSQKQQQEASTSQQQPPAPQQQQPPPLQQQRPDVPQQQQRPGVPQQQQRPDVPQQQQRPGVPQQQQRPGVPQQQQRPDVPQQQQRPSVPQQQRRNVPQQQTPDVPQQQMPDVPQQQQRPSVPQQQRCGVPQQQRCGVLQQQTSDILQQQSRPDAPQQQRPSVPQQQQRPSSSQQQRPSVPQQQQRPCAPQQQQQQQQPPNLQQLPSTSQIEQLALSNQLLQFSIKPPGGNGKYVMPSALHKMYMDLIPVKKTATGGTHGRRIQVETNMFQILFKPNFRTNIVHYDVIITPERPKFLFRSIFEAYRKKHFPNRYPAFDGRKNAYSGNELPFGDRSIEDEIKVFDHERQQERVWKIYLQKVAVLDLSWVKNLSSGLDESEKESKDLQALDIIFRHGPAYQFTPVGRSLFPKPEPGRVITLPDGMDLWVGVFQSVSVGKRAYLNIDVAHKGFPREQSVIALLKELCRRHPRDPPLETIEPEDVRRNTDKINKFLKGLKVQYELPRQPTAKRTYRVNKLVECPRKNKFRLENDTVCTVEQYFLQTKNYKIQFPELPCLWVGSLNSNIHLPMELCTIVSGQVTQKKLNEDQTAAMIKYAATDARKRKEKIMNGFANMRLNEQPTLLNEFNLSVEGKFEKVPARVLQPPVLQYQREVNVVKGVWRAEKFLKACSLADNSWTILNLDGRLRDRDLYHLRDSLIDGAAAVNMTIGKPLTPFGNLVIQKNIINIMTYFQDKKKQELRLVVVVIPVLDNAYSLVKQISELKVTGGIVTQCLKSRTLGKLSPSTVTNILLKINSKLNGVNHSFAPTYKPLCLRVPCMLVGADVTHPSPDATDIPSIAAVAASHDPNAFQYNIELRLQSPREEMIQSLEEIMRLQLIYFFKKTGYKPKKIIFYRDGVSEGQLAHVMHFELSAIKRAIAKLEKSSESMIPITFLVVQKRHHIRLFPTDNNCDPKNFNVLAGTIVDTEITHPRHIDFYLVSHTSIQGTARPTKYRCICNENNMSEDEIEQLTYYLCHMFARCTRSVSYPAPTYYAHLAAFRARALIHNVPLDIGNLEEAQRTNMNLQMNAHSPMFFV